MDDGASTERRYRTIVSGTVRRGLLVSFVLVLAPLLARGVRASEKSAGKGWYCFLGWNAGGQAVEGCERGREDCERDLSRHELDKPTKCFASKKAAAFVLEHAGAKRETIAVPQMEACIALREEMKGEAGVVRASECKMIP